MAEIDTSPEGMARLVGRLTREYGETATANFALDDQLNLALLQIQAQTALVEGKDVIIKAMRDQIAEMGADMDKLRLQLDPANTHRYARAKRKPRKAI